jgi:glycerophosphoryl diester phosphodiesterase
VRPVPPCRFAGLPRRRLRLPSWLTATPIAHRGLHRLSAGVPENTLAAFDAGASAGYALEMDVQLSRDGVPMVFHDERLKRLTGAAGLMADRTAAELADLRVLATGEPVPTLGQVVRHVAGRVPLVVELKRPPQPDGRLEAAVARVLAEQRCDHVVQSFDPAVLESYRRLRPTTPRGQIAMRFTRYSGEFPLWRALPLEHLLANWRSRPHFIAYDIEGLPHPAPLAWQAAGLPLLTWTVKTRRQLAKARAIADNVIFETIDPDRD